MNSPILDVQLPLDSFNYCISQHLLEPNSLLLGRLESQHQPERYNILGSNHKAGIYDVIHVIRLAITGKDESRFLDYRRSAVSMSFQRVF